MDRYTRKRPAIWFIGWTALIALGLTILAALVWALFPSKATAESISNYKALSGITVEQNSDYYQMSNHGAEVTDTALIFFPGAHVSSEAYLAKLGPQASRGVTIFVVKPPLQFSILGQGLAAKIMASHTSVHNWYVGGHSLGGVTACSVVAKNPSKFQGLILWGSYCNDDISALTSVSALSLSGSLDGLSTPAKIATAKHLLPTNTTMTEIPGADHADFGDYGKQIGDNPGTISRADMKTALTDALSRYILAPTP